MDFENLTNRLLEEWNKCEHATDDVNEDGSRRSRADLETIFERVGLQSTIANKLTNEIYSKLGIDTEQMITFFDFMALIQRDTELMRQSKMCDDGGNKSGCDELRGGEKMYVISPTSANLLPLDIHSNSGLSCNRVEEFFSLFMFFDLMSMCFSFLFLSHHLYAALVFTYLE